MIPDNVEKIIMTKEDYDRNVEQLLLDKCKAEQEIERLNSDYLEMKDNFRTANEEIERLNNIINTMLDFNFFKEECPLNFGYTEKCDEEKAQDVFYEDDYCEENCNDDYKKCWLKYFERLQELKGE